MNKNPKYAPNLACDVCQGEWLEDSKTGRFSRFATEPEESTWICNECGAVADPHDSGCDECGAEPDFF